MNVIELLRSHSIEPGRPASSAKGGEYHSACPGCGDGGKGKDSDRFHVWPEQNEGSGSYWCRQCGKGGDNIQFLIDFEGRSYRSACERLGRVPGEKPFVPVSPAMASGSGPGKGAGGKGSAAAGSMWSPRAYDSPAEVWREKAGNFVSHCHEQLMENAGMLEYLAGRGIDADTAAAARLGYNPKDLFRPREAWGLSTEIKDNGQKKKLWLPAGIVIPRMNADGMVDRIRVRRFVDPDAAAGGRGAGGKASGKKSLSAKKYYVVPGSTAAPAVYGDINKDAWVIIEAELDGLLVYAAAGDVVTVCALGSNTNRPDTSIFSKIKGSLCILDALDYDAGGSGQQGWWQAQFDQVERWPVPEGKDPGEAFDAGVDIREWILAGLPPRWRVERRVGRSRNFPQGGVAREGAAVSDAGKVDEIPAEAGEKPVEAGENRAKADQKTGAGAADPGAADAGADPDPVPGPRPEAGGGGSGGAEEPAAGLPEGVIALAEALKNTPVSIVTRPKRITIVCDVHGWDHRNWDQFSRISDLLFGDDAVYWHVRGLPAGRYTWRNIMNI